MSVTCPQNYNVAKSGSQHVLIDWGDNTAGNKTGALAAGDTVASCVVALDDSPTGSTTPTLGAVSVPGSNSSSDDINGRVWAAGEATSCLVTMGASQTFGKYRLKFTATTTNGEIIPRFVVINCVSGAG